MRATLRLLTARLPPFTPTGITGVLTHPHPRPTLIAVYNQTLQTLAQLPANSVYRQSAENLTKARLDIVKAVKPEGYAGFQEALKEKGLPAERDPDIAEVGAFMRDLLGRLVAVTQMEGIRSYVKEEIKHWEGVALAGGLPEPTEEEEGEEGEEEVLLEPQLSAEQVAEIEERIGEGLIEEVVDEGWAELTCARAMAEGKVWEPLEVVPEEGQWVAFERTPSGL
jgi:NADH dehydrogenase (ubiquinone) 1 alpha subcomplex subunit 5